MPITTFISRKLCFILGTSYIESIWCTSYPDVYINNFRKGWSFIWGCFFPVSTLKQCEFLRFKHLAKVCGNTTENQWDYLKNVCSIHKSFKFLERLCDSLRITLSFEFYNFLIATKQNALLKQFLNLMWLYIEYHSYVKRLYRRRLIVWPSFPEKHWFVRYCWKYYFALHRRRNNKLGSSHSSIKRVCPLCNDKHLIARNMVLL